MGGAASPLYQRRHSSWMLISKHNQAQIMRHSQQPLCLIRLQIRSASKGLSKERKHWIVLTYDARNNAPSFSFSMEGSTQTRTDNANAREDLASVPTETSYRHAQNFQRALQLSFPGYIFGCSQERHLRQREAYTVSSSTLA